MTNNDVTIIDINESALNKIKHRLDLKKIVATYTLPPLFKQLSVARKI